MKKLSVYCAHPISGLTWDEVHTYYEEIKIYLEGCGFNVFHPMTGKKDIRTDPLEKFKPNGYKSPFASNHAIFERDKWMVTQSDVLYLDLTNYESTSIGCMMELAWGSILGKHTVVVMEKNNVHQHAFVLEAADLVLDSVVEAKEYLKKLAVQRV